MRMTVKYILLLLVGLLLSSCDFDHLYYETSRMALVRIDVDWESSHITPNGVSAYIYDSSGDLYSEQLSNNPNVIFLKLPAGCYTIVLHNNSISELSGVELRNMSRLESASIYATERSDQPSFDVVGDEMLFVNEPDDVVSCTLRDIEITASDVEYHYYKPNVSEYEQEATHIYTASPLHIVHLSRVIAHISGLQYAQGAPKAILRGMSGGYMFDAQHTCDGDVMEEFSVNTRVSKADDSDEDTIYVDYNTFGMHVTDPEEQRYYLDIRFWLIDGSYKDYHIDITDDIRTETSMTQNTHIIEVALESLPEVEGDSNPDEESGGGEFDPSTDDWIDVEVTLPM